MLNTNQRMMQDQKRLRPQGQTMQRTAATDMQPQRAAQANPPQVPTRAPPVPATRGARTSPVFQAGKPPQQQQPTPNQALHTSAPAQYAAAPGGAQQGGLVQQSMPGQGIVAQPGSMSPQPAPQPGGGYMQPAGPVSAVATGTGAFNSGKPTAGTGGILGAITGTGAQPIGGADPTPGNAPPGAPPLVHDDRTWQQMMQDALMEKLMGGASTAEEEALIQQMMQAQVGQGIADARANMGGGGFAVGGALNALEGDIRREGALAASGQIADLRRAEEEAWLNEVLGLTGALQGERELGIYETAFERALRMLDEQGGGGGGGGGGPEFGVDENGNVTSTAVGEDVAEGTAAAQDAMAVFAGVPEDAMLKGRPGPEATNRRKVGPYTVWEERGVTHYSFGDYTDPTYD